VVIAPSIPLTSQAVIVPSVTWIRKLSSERATMSETVLLRFLERGLINVGGDDTKLEKLQATAAAVSGVLKKLPSKVPNYSLVAFDPDVSAADPVVVEVLANLKDLWPTYINTFASAPISVLRAIILDALVEAAHEDDRVAVAVAASARSVLPFMETGNEHSIWVDVVNEIERAVDSRAEHEWSTPSSIALVQLQPAAMAQIEVTNSTVTINRETLKQQCITAALGNGVHPNQNFNAWATNFGNKLAEPLADLLEQISVNAKVDAVDLTPPMQQIIIDVSTYVTEAMKSFSSATFGLQRRTNLIWWKQALYSPSKQKSYRAFPRTIASALMALDLYQQIPMFSPASVSAFLEEAVHSLPSTPSLGQRSLMEILREACVDPVIDVLRVEAAKLFATPSGRSPVLALIAHPEKLNGLKDEELKAITGVSPEVSITDSQWASWLFRDLQAGRATKEQPKKRGGKGAA
jgi:hypothetical protein